MSPDDSDPTWTPFSPSAGNVAVDASHQFPGFDPSGASLIDATHATAIDPSLQPSQPYPPHLMAMMGGVIHAPPPGAAMSYLPPMAVPPPPPPVASGSGLVFIDAGVPPPPKPVKAPKPPKGKKGGPNSRAKPPPVDPNMPLPEGFTHDDLIPKIVIDEKTGEHIYPCPSPGCPKKYTGKHARSIWRRHLQDKHQIPLAAQPRRTRWDNDTNRPKSDVERRERTLESKRRWARKNRATTRGRGEGGTDDGFDDGDSSRSMSPDSLTRSNTLAVPAVLLERSLSSASNGSNVTYDSTAPTSRSPSVYDDGEDVFESRPLPPMMLRSGEMVVPQVPYPMDPHAAFALTLGHPQPYAHQPPPFLQPSFTHPSPPAFALHHPAPHSDHSPPPAPLVHRTVSSGPGMMRSSLSLQIGSLGAGPGPLSAPLFPTNTHDEFFGPQPSPPSGVMSSASDGDGVAAMDEDEPTVAMGSRRRTSTPPPPAEREQEAASLLLGLKTGSSPVQEVNASTSTVDASFAATEYSFRLPSSPGSSPAPSSSKHQPTTPGDHLVHLPPPHHAYHHPLPPLMPHLPMTTSSSPWPSTPRNGIYPGQYQLPPMMPDEFKQQRGGRHHAAHSSPSAPSGFLLSSPANAGLSAELGLAPSHYEGAMDDYAAVPPQLHSSAIKPRGTHHHLPPIHQLQH